MVVSSPEQASPWSTREARDRSRTRRHIASTDQSWSTYCRLPWKHGTTSSELSSPGKPPLVEDMAASYPYRGMGDGAGRYVRHYLARRFRPRVTELRCVTSRFAYLLRTMCASECIYVIEKCFATVITDAIV